MFMHFRSETIIMASSNTDKPKSTSTSDNSKSSPTKTLTIDSLDGTRGGPGTSNNFGNISSAIVSEANAVGSFQNDPRSSSPKTRSPIKSSGKSKNDRPPQNSRAYSPKKSRNYLDYDGDDSDEDNDGALAQVYGKVVK